MGAREARRYLGDAVHGGRLHDGHVGRGLARRARPKHGDRGRRVHAQAVLRGELQHVLRGAGAAAGSAQRAARFAWLRACATALRNGRRRALRGTDTALDSALRGQLQHVSHGFCKLNKAERGLALLAPQLVMHTADWLSALTRLTLNVSYALVSNVS